MPGSTITPVDLIRLNPGVWLETYGRIRNVRGKLIKPRLNVLQRRINALYVHAQNLQRPLRAIGVKPRKRGFSTMVGGIHYCHLSNWSNEGLIVGDKLDTSDLVFRMMDTFAQHDKFGEVCPHWGSKSKWGAETAEWDHGSLLRQGTAKGKATARGSTPQFEHGTEAAHWDGGEEAFDAMLNAIPDEGFNVVFLESTPFGMEGPFATTFIGARWPTAAECPEGILYWKQWEALMPDVPPDPLAEHSWVRIFAAWYEFEESRIKLTDKQKSEIRASIDAEGWYQGERELIDTYGNEGPVGLRLGAEVTGADVWEQLAWRRVIMKTKCRSNRKVFDEEHPRDPKSAFQASGRQVFDPDAISYLQELCRIPREYGTLNVTDRRAVWSRSGEDSANYWLWERPRIGCRYIISADLAEGEDQTKGDDPDAHSILVWRREYLDNRGVRYKTRLVARVRPPNRIPLIPLARLTINLALYYGNCCIIPEMNNSGLAFIVALKAADPRVNIWQRREIDPHSGQERRWDGWRTTDSAEYKGLRATIIWHLHEVLRSRELDMACPHVCRELSAFVDKLGRMEAGSGHDDDVLSTAIGIYNIDSATVYAEEVVPRTLPRDLRGMAASLGGTSMQA